MTIFEEEVRKPEYSFLTTDEHLGDNIAILCVGGSYSYGMNVPTSDVDIRGVAVNSARELLLANGFEQVERDDPDVVIYSFNKILNLLSACNPNVIEMLGLRPEHYLKVSKYGQMLLDNKDLFLSKVAVQSFGGYANAQLRRLDNKAGRIGDAHNQAVHIVNSMKNALYAVKQLVRPFNADENFELVLDESNQVIVNASLKGYPLNELYRLVAESDKVRHDYEKLGVRNSKAIEHNKIGKHMAHLFRLYMMAFDILEKKQIITYRADEHDFLMRVRNNELLDENGQPTEEFWETLQKYEARFEYAKLHTDLPDRPNYKRIEDLRLTVNSEIVKESLV